jgi:uncharacterized RDD family membrane protein YckC
VLDAEDLDGPPLPAGVVLAPLGRRLAARVIDEVPFLLVQVLCVALLGTVRTDGGSFDIEQPLWVSVAVVAAGVLYETAMVAWRGQTVGKLALDVVVVRADDGARPDLHQAALRALVPAALGAVPVVGPVLAVGAMAWALGDPRRQGLHDKGAGTLVVRAAA